jgi:hypothetical protein
MKRCIFESHQLCQMNKTDEDDSIVRYTGATKSGIFWMAVDDFERIFEDFNGEIDLRKDGYIQYRG